MSEIVITRHNQGNIFEAQLDDVIVFRLEENLTTGYGWEVESIDNSMVELIESTYTEAPGMLLGRGGMRVLRFVVRSPGSQDIRLRLRRPWDPPDKALEHLEVTIRVRRITGD
jgi:predicted secreted protein